MTSQAADGWPGPASQPVSQFRPRIASAVVRASSSVSSLVTWLRSMTCRKSSTAVLLACSPLAPLLLPGGGRIAVAAAGSGEGVVVNRLCSFTVVLLAEEGDVVDAGGAGGVVAAAGIFRAGLGVGVPGDVMRGRGPGVLAAVPDEQHGQVEWVEDQLHAPAGEHRAGLVLVPVQGDQGRLGHGPPFGPAERLSQVPAGGERERAAGFPPGQRRLPGLRMLPDVINRLGPGREQLVQFRQARQPGGAVLGELGEELAADSPEEALY